MGIAILAAARLMHAVPAWAGDLKPRLSADRSGTSSKQAAPGRTDAPWTDLAAGMGGLLVRLMQRRLPARAPTPLQRVVCAARPRPLRVLRVLEPQQPRACAGRMVISGRMADVCAELDRLAAAEAACRP